MAGRVKVTARGAVMLVLCLLVSSCGTRLSHARLLADASRTSGVTTTTRAGADATSTAADDDGSLTLGVDPGSNGSSSANPATGSNDVGTVADTGAAAVATKCARTKAPIRIATVGEQTGVVGSVIVNGPRAVQAWAASVNANGGLDCHPIEYTIADDGGDSARMQSQVRQLVEQKHVIAFVHMDSPLARPASVSYLTQHRIPVIGGEGGGGGFYESPMFFPQMISGPPLNVAGMASIAQFSKAAKLSKLGIVACIEAEQCQSVYREAPGLAARFGVNVVYRAQVSIAYPDYTSQCQGAKTAGADMIDLAMDANSQLRFARSCQSVGYHPIVLTAGSLATQELLSNPAFEGAHIGGQTLPWMIANHPEIAEYDRVLNKYAPALRHGAATITGWVSAKLFERAAQHLSEIPTSQDLLNGLWSIHNEDLKGLTIPLSFTKDKPAPQTPYCWWQIAIKSGKYISPDGGKRSCL